MYVSIAGHTIRQPGLLCQKANVDITQMAIQLFSVVDAIWYYALSQIRQKIVMSVVIYTFYG